MGIITQEPSYYMVSFISKFTSDINHEEYSEIAQLMVSLAQKQPGYLGVDSVRDPITTQGITISYWKDKSCILNWKQNIDHQLAQRNGKGKFYSQFQVKIAKVESAYEFNKDA